MLSPPRHTYRESDRRRIAGLAALTVLLATAATAQTQQNTVQPLPQQRVQKVQTPAPVPRPQPTPVNGVRNAPGTVNANQRNVLNAPANRNVGATGATGQRTQNSTQAQQQLRNLFGAGNSSNNSQQAPRQGATNTNQTQQLRNLFGTGGNNSQATRQGASNSNRLQQNASNLANSATGSNNARNGARNVPAAGSAGSNAVPASRGAAMNPSASRTSLSPSTDAAQRRGFASQASSVPNTRNGPSRMASLDNQAQAARAVQSRTFVGHPGPLGSTEVQTGRGMIVRKAADGSIMDVHSPRNGMYIHHGLDGNQRITVNKPDRSRIVAATTGIQYVQHPYSYRGQAFDQRTYVVQGRLVRQFYRPYTYGGETLDVYTPSRYYQPELYAWANTQFRPQPVTWAYTTTATPWFDYYRGYFTPEPSYTSPVSWLTDYLLAANLAEAYKTRSSQSSAPPSGGSPAITPEVKQKVTEEVGRQVKQEEVEARANAQNKSLTGTAGSVVEELADGNSHVFVVASDLDLVDPKGRRCMISEGDVIEVVSPPQPNTSTAEAVVLATKGGVECQRATKVDVALSDLQEMQNHMRETIDQGMENSNAGKKAATVKPAFAAAAPPPDANAAHEIDQERRIAAETEG